MPPKTKKKTMTVARWNKETADLAARADDLNRTAKAIYAAIDRINAATAERGEEDDVEVDLPTIPAPASVLS